jgi:hypothetical protein
VPDIFKLLQANFELMLGLALLWVVGWALFFAWRRYRREPIHPPFAEQDVRFTEHFASGFSRKNLFTRFAGAHNALVVRVLEDALLIEPIAIFKWITPAGFNDLEHYVPRKDILSVEPVPGFGKKAFKIQFLAKDGSPRTLELVLRKPREFRSALDL